MIKHTPCICSMSNWIKNCTYTMACVLCPFAKERGFSWLPATHTHKFRSLALTGSAAGSQHGNTGWAGPAPGHHNETETPSISHGAGSRHPKQSRWMLSASSAVLTTLLPIQHLPYSHGNTDWCRGRAGSLLFLCCFPLDLDKGPTGPGLYAVPSLLLP